MNMRRPFPIPGYGIGAGFYGLEMEAALGIRDRDAETLEVWVEGCVMGVVWMVVPAEGVRLPDLQAYAFHRLAVHVEDPAHEVKDLSLRLARFSLDDSQVSVLVRRFGHGIERPHHLFGSNLSCRFGE